LQCRRKGPSEHSSPEKPLLPQPCHHGHEHVSVSHEDVVTTRIYAGGVCCPMEIPVVDSVLSRLPGILEVRVAVVTRTVHVVHRPALATPAAIVAALNEARLEATLTFPRRQGSAATSWIPPAHVLISAGLLVLSLLYLLAGPTGVPWLEHFKWVALGAVAVCLPRILLKALGALRGWVLDIHFLMTVAVAGAIALGDYSEAAAVVVLFSAADFLEGRCSNRARDAIAAVLALRPEAAVLADTGIEVAAEAVGVGDRVLVRSGDKVPVDGIVESGSSAFGKNSKEVPLIEGPRNGWFGLV
jgi:Zn2+/Cd2+-exporting ATPase